MKTIRQYCEEAKGVLLAAFKCDGIDKEEVLLLLADIGELSEWEELDARALILLLITQVEIGTQRQRELKKIVKEMEKNAEESRECWTTRKGAAGSSSRPKLNTINLDLQCPNLARRRIFKSLRTPEYTLVRQAPPETTAIDPFKMTQKEIESCTARSNAIAEYRKYAASAERGGVLRAKKRFIVDYNQGEFGPYTDLFKVTGKLTFQTLERWLSKHKATTTP